MGLQSKLMWLWSLIMMDIPHPHMFGLSFRRHGITRVMKFQWNILTLCQRHTTAWNKDERVKYLSYKGGNISLQLVFVMVKSTYMFVKVMKLKDKPILTDISSVLAIMTLTVLQPYTDIFPCLLKSKSMLILIKHKTYFALLSFDLYSLLHINMLNHFVTYIKMHST